MCHYTGRSQSRWPCVNNQIALPGRQCKSLWWVVSPGPLKRLFFFKEKCRDPYTNTDLSQNTHGPYFCLSHAQSVCRVFQSPKSFTFVTLESPIPAMTTSSLRFPQRRKVALQLHYKVAGLSSSLLRSLENSQRRPTRLGLPDGIF